MSTKTDRRALEFEVSAHEGFIQIRQPGDDPGTEERIGLHPDQVDLVAKWLRDAQIEIINARGAP